MPHPQVDALFATATTWIAERAVLRPILLSSPLTEDFKWKKAVYTYENKNVVVFFGLKDRCGLGFFKGALMPDPAGVLEQQGEHSQAVRLMPFTSADAITAQEATIRAYLNAAIEVERAGLSVDFKEKHALVYPAELTARLAADPQLAAAFKALTPGRQRGYVLNIEGAKQAATRTARIDKHRARILDGKGLNDR